MDGRLLVFSNLFFGYRNGHRNKGPHKVHGRRPSCLVKRVLREIITLY